MPLGSSVAVCCHARGGEAAGGCPGPGRRIVEFRAREICEAVVKTSRDEHLAVGQQRRRVRQRAVARLPVAVQVPAGRIVEFRAGESEVAAVAPPATSTLPLGSNVAV